MGRGATQTALQVSESVGNMPLPAAKQAFLREFFQNGGDGAGAARFAFPKHSRPDMKALQLKRQLAPYIRMAALEYTEQLRPVALGVVVQLMNGSIADTPPAVRLKAAEVILERADRMLPQEEGGTKGKLDNTLEGVIRLVLNAVGKEIALQILGAKGIPLAKIEEVAGLSAPKMIEVEKDESTGS